MTQAINGGNPIRIRVPTALEPEQTDVVHVVVGCERVEARLHVDARR